MIDWKCPKCGVTETGCEGKDIKKRCMNNSVANCMGFICECDWDGDDDEHGTHKDPCPEANCYHCGWGGKFPIGPAGIMDWEQKALDAGWKPPAKRKKELKL